MDADVTLAVLAGYIILGALQLSPLDIWEASNHRLKRQATMRSATLLLPLIFVSRDFSTHGKRLRCENVLVTIIIEICCRV